MKVCVWGCVYVCMLFHEWTKLMKGESVNRKRILNFEPLQLIGLPILLTSCCFSAVPRLSINKERSLWVCHLCLLLSITSLTSLLNYSLLPLLTSLICLLKLLVSITPSWIICSLSLISYLKPGNERLGTVIVSCLVPVWPASSLSNNLFKGSTGRAGDTDERAGDDICFTNLGIVHHLHIFTVFYAMPCLLMACFPFNIKQWNKL